MGSLEVLVLVVTVIFFLLRALFRGLRWLFRLARKSMAPPAQATAEEARQRARPEAPTPSARPSLSSPDPPRVRNGSERTPTSSARTIARNVPLQTTVTISPEKSLLSADRDELLRAMMWREILSPPLSQRSRKPPPSP